MKTSKINIIALAEGDQLEIHAGGARLQIACVDALERDTLQISIPPGTSIASIKAGSESNLISFVDEGFLTDQLDGPVTAIIFREIVTMEAEPFSAEQLDYLLSQGIRIVDDEGENVGT